MKMTGKIQHGNLTEHLCDTKSAFLWSELNNAQRKLVIKRFEQDYGIDFAHVVGFGNSSDRPRVKQGKLLSGLSDFSEDSLGFYLNRMLGDIFDTRTMRKFEFRMEKVVPRVLTEDTEFNVTLPLGCPDEMGIYFDTAEAAKKSADEHTKTIDAFPSSSKKKVLPVGTTVYELFCHDGKKWIPDPEWPRFIKQEMAIERAQHNLRFTAAFFIQWDAWEAAGYKKPESYDPFAENIFSFEKKHLLEFEKRTMDYNLRDSRYGSHILDENEDTEFMQWCRDTLACA